MNIREILHQTAVRLPAKPAFIYRQQPISFSQLENHVLNLASALSRLGIKKGDRVGIYLPNTPEYIYSYLAIFCLGAVGVPLDYMLKEDELISCLSHSQTRLLIAQPKETLSLTALKQAVPGLEKIILSQGTDAAGDVSFEKILGERWPILEPVAIKDSDSALIMYTSGTTGKPKGILLNYKHLEGSPEAMKYFVDLSDRDIKLSALPLSHIAGLIYIQNSIVFGITVILMDRFNPLEFLRNIQEYRVTCFHVVPAMYVALLSLKDIDKFDLSSLRWIVVFGAPSAPEMLRRFHQHCPNARFLNGWGMTETCPPNTVTPLDSNRIESVGKPSPFSEIRIFDEDDQALPAGEIGEIVIRGWVVMQEYYKDPEATTLAKRNGWFHTGDLGQFDQDGFLFIVGRKKEMIKVGGQIVYAPEVEAALAKHASVQEAAVIGVPDELRGEVVKAFVVLKEKMAISAEDLRYFAQKHLAHFKVPQTIHILEDLPRNRTGKVDKELLKSGQHS